MATKKTAPKKPAKAAKPAKKRPAKPVPTDKLAGGPGEPRT